MAYVSPEMKAARAPAIKALLKEYGLKGTLSVRNHMSLVLTVSSGSIDFIGQTNEYNRKHAEMVGETPWVIKGHTDVNVYHIDRHYTGKAAEFLNKAVDLLKGDDYFDDSDIQTDYFHTSHYVDIRIGRWNKDYILV